MPQIDYKEYIQNKLIKQGYDRKPASLVAAEIVNIAPQLQPIVDNWLNGVEADYSSQGYSILGLMESRGMTYPAALLTIDWLIREPEKALESLNRGVK